MSGKPLPGNRLVGAVVAKIIPNPEQKRFDIAIVGGVSAEEMQQAALGTVQNGCMAYTLDNETVAHETGVLMKSAEYKPRFVLQKTYSTPIKTLRGDYKDANGNTANRLRRWEKHEFKPRPDDIFQERLYCIQWITAESLDKKQKMTFFAAVTEEDLARERQIEQIVAENIAQWQQQGFVPDMAIEPGYNTDQPIRERGWTYWHHLFSPRNLVIASMVRKQIVDFTSLNLLDLINFNAKLCRWTSSPKRIAKDGTGKQVGGASDNATDVFSNQALNTFYNYAFRGFDGLSECLIPYYHKRGYTFSGSHAPRGNECGRAASRDAGASQTAFPRGAWERDLREKVRCQECNKLQETCDLWLTDPPYADAIHYHEITEFFIAWLRKNPPAPFDEWIWDSRRALAIKGSGDDFRRGMIEAYTAMTQHMPDNGMQCVMFTHQDTGVWSDMVGIFWAAGLQVVGAWYIATETTSELKKGGYVQGTVILMLRKRPAGENRNFKNRILPAVRKEVEAQITQMLHLNADVKNKLGEPVFNDSDLQMAGYAAALKVLTAYTHIGDEDATTFALRPRQKGQVTVVDEIVQQASEAANSLLIPEGLQPETWNAVKGIQRFYLRMLDIETTGASKLDNYQNFAKAFHVEDYTKVMASMAPNKARMKSIEEFTSRDLTDSTEIGPTYLGKLIIALQQLLQDKEPQTVMDYLHSDVTHFLEARPLLINMVDFIATKTKTSKVRDTAEILAARMRNQRLA
ncbi:MAG: hypothetical protein Q8N96_12215 [Methylovulum sp.]|nr:hypothetical protein [Methylovulum sp.]